MKVRGGDRRRVHRPGGHHHRSFHPALVTITLFGVGALSFMMAMYALEERGRRYVAAFALGCALSSSYGFLSGAWPFGVVEAIWTVIALRRFVSARDEP
jgi:hypothetical protein